MSFIMSAVNRFLVSLIILEALFVGTSFILVSHADPALNLAGKVVWNSDHSKNIPAEDKRKMALGSTKSGEVRMKGLPVGLWGGEHISMQVTERRTTIEYDCAHGTIEQRIILDRRGRFNVPGTQVAEHGGPVRQNEQLTGEPVRFSGQVNGKIMKLSVSNSVKKTLIGNFTLVYGVEAKLRKCR